MIKDMIRLGGILALICGAAAGLLGGVHALTEPKIIAQAQAEENAGLRDVFPQADHFEAVQSDGVVQYYRAFDKDSGVIGAAFKASGKGYAGAVETMAGMRNDGTITAVKVLSQNETPGLGSRVAEDAFTGQFAGKDAVLLDGVQAITGATISSRAVMESVKTKAAQVKELMSHER